MLDRQWRLDYEQRAKEAAEKREDARDAAMNAREDVRDANTEKREDVRVANTERWHSDDLKILKSQHRWQLFWFGMAVVGATIVGSMIQAAWIPKPW